MSDLLCLRVTLDVSLPAEGMATLCPCVLNTLTAADICSLLT